MLRCLDARGQEWEWQCGPFDYHVAFEPETQSWVLEQFRSEEPEAEKAHRLEQECDSLADALLFSIGEVDGPKTSSRGSKGP
jgi:hypothetical protein